MRGGGSERELREALVRCFFKQNIGLAKGDASLSRLQCQRLLQQLRPMRAKVRRPFDDHVSDARRAAGPAAGGKASFQFAWHRGRVFELTFDARQRTLRLPELLIDVPADITMYDDLKSFIRSRQSGNLPDHRRLDTRKIQIRTYNRGGNILLTFKFKDRDVEYAVRKLIHLVNEIYLTFLADGKYFDYLVETFNLDPDRM